MVDFASASSYGTAGWFKIYGIGVVDLADRQALFI